MFSCNGQTVDLLSIPERLFSGNTRDYEVALIVETLLQVDITYGLSEIITFSDAHEAARFM